MNTFRWIVTAAAAAGAASLGAGFSFAADPKPAAAFKVGYVDLAQVSDELRKTPEWLQFEKDFEDTRQRLRQDLEEMGAIRYLTPAERAELQNLKAKTKPSDNEKARIKELTEKSDRIDSEYATLANTEKPTDEQRARLNQLALLRQESTQGLQKETEKASQSLVQKESTLVAKAQDKILKLVESVARAKKLDLVLDREFVFFGGEDLTAEVSKRLK